MNETNRTPSSDRTRAGRAQGGRGQNKNAGNRRGRSGSRGYQQSRRHHGAQSFTKKPSAAAAPAIEPGVIRIIPLGGVEEVGRNMTLVEYGDDIIVIDAGFQFVEEETPGIDYFLPNTGYLEANKHKIRGLCITHGHLDHIGGIPYIMDRIGNPPIFTRELTTLMIKKRQSEFPHLPALNFQAVEPGEMHKLGSLPVRFFEVTHSIPDSMGLSIETPHGNVVLTGDLKLDHIKGEPTQEEKDRWAQVGSRKNLFFIADSTNAENPGFSVAEREIFQKLDEIIRTAPHRLIIGTFASQFERMMRIIEMAASHGKVVITEGRSIKTNIEIAKEAGRLKANNIIPIDQIDTVDPEKVVVLATGAQGEEFAALMRIGNGSHRYIKLTDKDTVLLSSSVIPGNEISVQKLKDALYQHDVRVIHYRVSDVHASGHGNQEELKWINKQVGAKFFMPAYGYHSMCRVHAQTIRDAGFPKENIVVPKNSQIIEVFNEGTEMRVRAESAPANIQTVDGFAIGDIQEVVIRDRKALAQDGMFVVIANLNLKTGKLKKSPDIISRGFVYLRESQDLLSHARLVVKKTIESKAEGMHPINIDYVKEAVTDEIARFLFQKTNKHPIVIPVIIGV